ncbi:outer membrane receptor protein involved in Fe transport [Pedobacter sp. CAN_A7]|uniref:TonB-dependent receptor domain-containing protein n=1 Tax=Pedobacter sp. CAN_A7 TaxID=2787722 RepID=UPI001A332ACC
MKRILLLFIVLGMVSSAKAQFPMGGGAAKVTVTGRITAVIIDSLTQKPVDYATVSLVKVKDNKSVNGGLTDDKGKIVMQNVVPDEYKLSIGFMGYKTKSVQVKTTPERPDNNIGTIILAPTASNLKEVEISGQKAMVENKIDRMVYNADQDVTVAGGTAGDVMRKVPLLSVDIEGNVTLRGSAVRVLINGKPSGTMANSVADALKMIPAEEIKTVEVITSPSAKYDAEGTGGIINIITKKKTAQGVSGSVNTSVGTRQNNGNVSLNAKKGRLGFTSNIGTQYAIPQDTRVEILNQNYITNRGVLQQGTTKANRWGYNGSAGLDYDINNYNSLSTNVKFNRFENGSDGSLDVRNINAAGDTENYSRYTDNAMVFKNVDWSADYRRTTKKEGEEFALMGQASFGQNVNEFNTVDRLANGNSTTINGDNTGKNNEYTVQADYTYPFSKVTVLETGMKGIFRNIQSKYQDSEQDFDYDQNVGAVYGVISFKLAKKTTVKGGLRAEYTKIGGQSGTELNFDNDYFNLFPSVILSQTLKGNSSVKLSYNKRMSRPSLFFLNPFQNQNDPENKTQGNPGLSPELSDNIELGYSTYIKGSVINASVFYRNTQDVIENVFDPAQKLTSYYNVGTRKSYGANAFASYNIKPKWTVMGNFNLNTYEVDGQESGASTGVKLNYSAFLRSAISFKGGWNTEIFGVYNGPRYTFQGKSGAMQFYGGAVKKEILNKKGTVGINVFNVFARDLHIESVNQSPTFLQSTNIYYPIRSFGINFSYSFGKINYNPTKKKKINNDDQKQGEQQGGMGTGTGQGGL